MTVVVINYLFAMLGIVNSQHVQEPVLAIINVAAAVFFLVAGSIAGWQFARRD